MAPKKANKWEADAESLRRRLEEAEETLGALRRGEIDALVVQTPDGDQVYALRGADHPYRVLVESMGEGAVTLSEKGLILHSNQAFARMAKSTHSKVIGSRFYDLFGTDCRGPLTEFVQGVAVGEPQRDEFQLAPGADTVVPVLLSASRLKLEDVQVICVVVTDLSKIRAAEQQLRKAHDQLEVRVRERTAELQEARDALEVRVQQRTDELRRLTDYLDRVREDESKRIAGEIHDELGATVTSAKLELAWLKQSLEDKKQVEGAQKVTRLLDDLVRAIRRISHDLRPSVLDAFGLLAGIEALVEDFRRRSHVDCNLQVSHSAGVGEFQALALYRICQEALTNIIRHAEATRVDIFLDAGKDKLILQVTDNGKGMSASKLAEGGSGLLGMRERAKRLGGDVTIASQEYQGTQVEAWVPLPIALEIRSAS